MNYYSFYSHFKYIISFFLKRNGFWSIPKDFRGEKSSSIDVKRVLIFSERYWSIHNAWELYVAKILELSDYKVTVIGCDGLNSFCDSYTLEKSESICSDCKLNLKKMCSFHGIEYVSMNEYHEKHKYDSKIQSPVVNDLGFNEIVECSVMRHLRSNQRSDVNWDIVEQKFVKALKKVDEFLSVFLEKYKFDYFFVLNGQFANSNLFLKYAKKYSVNYVTYERGNIKNSLIFSKNKNAVPFDMKDLFLGEEFNINLDELYNYLITREKVGNGHVPFFTDTISDIYHIREQLKLNYKNKTFVLFTNLIWDSAVYNQDTIFKNMYEWVVETILFFNDHPQFNLIIRIHPAEQKITWWKTRYSTMDAILDSGIILNQNIKVINSNEIFSSYSLMEISDVGLVYTSTTGLEMAIENKPVIMSANSNYSGCNLVYEPGSISEYLELLKINLKPLINQKKRVEKFLYLLYFVKTVKVNDLNESYTFNYTINSISDSDVQFKNALIKLFRD
jgi:hypothetical protein